MASPLNAPVSDRDDEIAMEKNAGLIMGVCHPRPTIIPHPELTSTTDE
jgi:hypothetical protein